jgi:hypothetical protein
LGTQRKRAYDRLIGALDGDRDTFLLANKRKARYFYDDRLIDVDVQRGERHHRDTFAYIKRFELGVDRLKVKGGGGRGGAYRIAELDQFDHLAQRISGLALVHRKDPGDVIAVLKGVAAGEVSVRDLFGG